ncbi:MAG TPA: ACT domain-containing protein [Gemmatimonadales bacterium]|jgi:methylmalonyl-CoA/ethylmalonyl-CoA epimerase|nr:ACT domain-containing protein [Gemmatimonadales bacterium]
MADAPPAFVPPARVGQIAIPVTDLERAVRFYGDTLGLRLMFRAPPGLAFFDCGGVRLMLTGVTGDGSPAAAGIIYYLVTDLVAAYEALSDKGVRFLDAPHCVARLPDHELWMAFCRDSEENLLALMSEVRPGPADRAPASRLPLELLEETLAVCRLPVDAALPDWADGASRFLTVSRTGEELSITAIQSIVPAGVRCERDYRALRVKSPLPLDLIGVLAAIADPLAAAGLSIFAISTFDTDYVLVKARDLEPALAALERAGHQVSRQAVGSP